MSVDSPVVDSSQTEIVLVGRFSPDEAHPAKLVEAKVITEAEHKFATFSGLLKGQLVEFSLGWASVQAVSQRLVFTSSQAPYVRIADLALKIVREGLKSPAISMMGINRQVMFKFPSIKARDAFGMRLSPAEAWGDWGKSIRAELAAESIESGRHGGLTSVAMRQAGLSDREAGWIEVTVAAASTPDSPLGALVRVNDHYQCSDAADPQTLSKDSRDASRTSRLLDALTANFDKSVQRSDGIVDGLV